MTTPHPVKRSAKATMLIEAAERMRGGKPKWSDEAEEAYLDTLGPLPWGEVSLDRSERTIRESREARAKRLGLTAGTAE